MFTPPDSLPDARKLDRAPRSQKRRVQTNRIGLYAHLVDVSAPNPLFSGLGRGSARRPDQKWSFADLMVLKNVSTTALS